MTIREIKRQFNVIDTMLTMHSELRDRNQLKALSIDIFLLSISVVLCATVFGSQNIISFFKTNPLWSKIIIGTSSLLVFLISLISLRVDWKQKAEKHDRACETLSRMKSEYRGLLISNNLPDNHVMERISQECNLTLSTLPKIPEKKFNKLKAIHHKKVELSKMIDKHPGSSILALKIRLFLVSNLKVLKSSSTLEDDDLNG